jgi:hypothetical protein
MVPGLAIFRWQSQPNNISPSKIKGPVPQMPEGCRSWLTGILKSEAYA